MSDAATVRLGIVSWNTAELLGRCLDCLPAALGSVPAEVVVVDNASADNSRQVAASRPGVRVIANPGNVGYARAMNQALLGSPVDVLIALNPDTAPPPGSLAALVDRLLGGGDVGLVAPVLVNPDGTPQHSAYRFPSPLTAAAVCFLPPAAQRGRLGRRLLLEAAPLPARPTDVDWAIGAVHVIRAEALAGEAPYDERWFMYVEDLELCRRLARRGWRRRYEADVAVPHAANASGALAWGQGRDRRWLEATYDWYARDRGRLAVRAWAAVNTAGVLAHLAALRALAVAGAPARAADRATRSHALRASLPLHARSLVFGPPPVDCSPPADPPAPARRTS